MFRRSLYFLGLFCSHLHLVTRPRLNHLLSYTLLKYIGIRLYTEIINFKWQKQVGYTYNFRERACQSITAILGY